MITGQKTISINVKIFAKSKDGLDTIFSNLRDDCISAIKVWEDSNHKFEDHVFLMNDSKCGNCGKTWPQCTCGKPNRSPVV